MGGTNLLTYTDKCDINLAGTGDANGPATLVVRSFSNTEPRTVELATEADKPVVMSFKNPEKFIAKDQLVKNKYRAISDFISGMTDRYAINLNNNYK